MLRICKISLSERLMVSFFLMITTTFRWRRLRYFERRCPGCRHDRVWGASHEDKFRCPGGFLDRSTEQKPYRGIDRSRRRFGGDSGLDNVARIYWIRVLTRNPSIEGRRCAHCALAIPLLSKMKESWPKRATELKSKTVIFLLITLRLLKILEF